MPPNKYQESELEFSPTKYIVAIFIGMILLIFGFLMMFYSETSGGGYTLIEWTNGELIPYPRATVTEYPYAGLGIMLMPLGLGIALTSMVWWNHEYKGLKGPESVLRPSPKKVKKRQIKY